jgi:cephalosporin hydroxylase
MRYVIDTELQTLTVEGSGSSLAQNLYTKGAFREISRHWLRVGWSLGYYSAFTWMGQPILQLPEDLIRLQETIYEVRPDLIIETGIYQGGSLLYYATLCQVLRKGRIVGVDICVPPAVRAILQEHQLGPLMTLLEGESTSPDVIHAVTKLQQPCETVMVILDSAHSREHVRAELELYSRFVTRGSYLVVADGIMRDLADVPGGEPSWVIDNPAVAAEDFLTAHPEFAICPRAGASATTYFTGGWLKRL